MFVWNMGQTSAPKVLESPDPTVRRQKMTTWGIVALAVFIAVGMGEWSKRQAAGETVIEPAVMEQAVKMAAAAAANVNVKVNVDESGVRKAESEKRKAKSGFRKSEMRRPRFRRVKERSDEALRAV